MSSKINQTSLLHDADSKGDPSRLFSRSSLLIPSSLHQAVLEGEFRPERQTAIYLIYNVIAHKCCSMKGKWTSIPDRRFAELVRNHTRKSVEKHWLETKGFIKIKKWVADDGTSKNAKVPGRVCQSYKIVEQKADCQWVDLWKRELTWSQQTGDDSYCQHTRRVLSEVSVDRDRANRMRDGKDEYSGLAPERRMSIVHWARTLELGAGNVRRGRRVNRLYSPWTSSPRELRRACTLCGEPIVTIDLQASQPTLIGVLAQDDSFSEACLRDEIYREVGNLFAVSREEAKPIFLSYIYGRNRRENARNKRALRVQQYVAKQFPKTHAFIVENKREEYRVFSRRLQNIEAELFLDGVLARLIEKDVPALTVHDSVTVPQPYLEAALNVASEILGQKLKGKARLKICGNGMEKEVEL